LPSPFAISRISERYERWAIADHHKVDDLIGHGRAVRIGDSDDHRLGELAPHLGLLGGTGSDDERGGDARLVGAGG
jgi:hypothetical protein